MAHSFGLMRVLAPLRARRNLSGLIVVTLLVTSLLGSLHHHRLVVPSDQRVMGAASGEEHLSRTMDCLACRAADAVSLTASPGVLPHLDSSTAIFDVAPAPAPARQEATSSPRAPPAQRPS